MAVIRLTQEGPHSLRSAWWSPSGCGQQPCELLPRAVDVGSGGRLRDPENDANFIEREALLVAQHDGGALVRSQLGQRRLERPTELIPFDGIGSRRRGWFGRFGARWDAAVFAEVRWSTRAPHRVDGGVVRDSKEPAGQTPCRVERGKAAEGLDEGFLCQVFGECEIAGHARQESDDRPLIAADDLLEGGLRSGQRLGHEPGFANGFQVNRDGAVLPGQPVKPYAEWCLAVARQCRFAGPDDGLRRGSWPCVDN
jgi:hypothetical protein